MKKVIQVLGLALCCNFIAGCAPKNEALPQNQENLDKLASVLKDRSKSLPITQTPERDLAVLSLYKKAIEGDLNYNFDKTFRSIVLFSNGNYFLNLLDPAIKIVKSNPEKALNENYISKRTYETLELLKKSPEPLAKNSEEFLSFVEECQKINKGVCKKEYLVNVLSSHNIKPEPSKWYGAGMSEQEMYMVDLASLLESTYKVSNIGINKWITKTNGDDFNTNFILESSEEFKLNSIAIETSKKLADLIQEEESALH